MIGLCIFTVCVVTARIPLADVGVALGALGLVTQRGRLRFPGPAWLFAIFVLWAWATAFASEFPEISDEGAFVTLKLFMILVVVMNALRSEQQIRVYLYIYVACFALQPARTTLQGYALDYTVWGRALGSANYNNPNDLALFTLMALGFALALATSPRERTAVRAMAWFCIVAFVAIILLTQSRGVFLGAVICFSPPLLVRLIKRPSRLIYAGIVTAALLFVVPSSAWERLAGMSYLTSTSTVAQADPEGSAAKRFEIVKAAWEMFLTHPFLGTGVGTYKMVLARDYPELGHTDAHNTYLSLAVELGLPGLILWCAMVWRILAVARRGRLSAGEGGLAIRQVWIERAMLGFLVAALFGTYWSISYLYLYLGVLWCRGTNLLEASSSKPGNPAGRAQPECLADGPVGPDPP
jgi:O-antigen ligase